MALSEKKINEYIKKLLLSRMRILYNHGFYGLLLMHMVYAVSEQVKTACTDGIKITFGTDFLDNLSDSELDFVMMHEILHVALQHCFRGEIYDPEAYNIAADIVVNSNILFENNMKESSITLRDYGVSMHIAPDGKEGYEYTAEQVYAMFQKKKGASKNGQRDQTRIWDDHSQWGKHDKNNISQAHCEKNDILREIWDYNLKNAAEAISIRDSSNSRGLLPKFASRILKEMKEGQVDWRAILNDFIQEEVVDYSFTPPDRRFDDSPFFLPDFNEKEDTPNDILFMIDTSGSMSDDMITAAYTEIKGAIDQFGGKLKGWLGFFDATIIEPQPFTDDEFVKIEPTGGGGTSFHIIFEYVMEHIDEMNPSSIIILTDGYAPFPPEEDAGDIPVLWLLNNEEVNPPWGKVARMKIT